MITFYNELPLDHKKPLHDLMEKWAINIYYDIDSDDRLNFSRDYCREQAWDSIGEHLWYEGLCVNVPVGKTFVQLGMSNHGYKRINEIYKYPDCQHCGDEWEYQCYECETTEREMSDE